MEVENDPPADANTVLDSTQPLIDNLQTPPKSSGKRKHSNNILSGEDATPVRNGNGPEKRKRPMGTRRACNQCRQQKLRCNVLEEEPYQECERCKKHKLRCEITSDFKRVGKRSQQAELERNNQYLRQSVDTLKRELASYRDEEPASASSDFADLYATVPIPVQLPPQMPMPPSLPRNPQVDRDLLSITSSARSHAKLPEGSDSHDAALLLNLKQGNEMRKLGDHFFSTERVHQLWSIFDLNYQPFLPVLDRDKDKPEIIFEKSEFLFWTVLLVASRHFYVEGQALVLRIIPAYSDILKDTICRPPANHYTVKALCLLCTWPLPVAHSTDDMTFALSGVMMKFAMQLGLHRPSHPMDFSRTKIQLREEDVSDRLRTWISCNIVAQNISTGYGQPPDTVYDATLQSACVKSLDESLYARLQIEKVVDRITKSVFCCRELNSANFAVSSNFVEVELMAIALQNLENTIDLSSPMNRLYANACALHLRLFVFFQEPNTPSYRLALNDLYDSAKVFLTSALTLPFELQNAPNYIQQMMLAAAGTLLRLLNSFFAQYVDRENDKRLFWDVINTIRSMSVETNVLPRRLAEVFSQLWIAAEKRADEDASAKANAHADFLGNGDVAHTGNRMDSGINEESIDDTRPLTPNKTANTSATKGVDFGIGIEVDAALSLKLRYRMSMSHVFDSVRIWKDELQDKFRREKLEDAINDPTSPQAPAHRRSFMNGRSLYMDDVSASVGIGPAFNGNGNGYGTVPLGMVNDSFNSSELFNPLGWFLDINPTNWNDLSY